MHHHRSPAEVCGRPPVPGGTVAVLLGALLLLAGPGRAADADADAARPGGYPIVGTGIAEAYDNRTPIPLPAPGMPFAGQDVQAGVAAPAYQDNGDGTVSDRVTGLMWQQDMGPKRTPAEAELALAALNHGAYHDWRVPTIKELFSLALYRGRVFGDRAVTLFIDTRFFHQPLGNAAAGEREIDAQTWSATDYSGSTMGGDRSRFGVNFVDGRIKAYPLIAPATGRPNRLYFRFVRGNPAYGRNLLVPSGVDTITDLATGLMWQRDDSGTGLDWQGALQHARAQRTGGYSDWRLPTIKELQSIVDYSRSPHSTGGPALHPLFRSSTILDPDGSLNWPFAWSSTTLLDGPEPGNLAAYVCFGRATAKPFGTALLDAHGAGAVRSDPKTAAGSTPPYFFGPQGDLVRVLNHCRCVRLIKRSVPMKPR